MRLRILLRLGREPENEQLGVGIPWAGGDAGGHTKGLCVLRSTVVVAKVVEHLLDAHGTLGDVVQLGARAEHATQIAVAGGIHVGGEGGEGIGGHAEKAILPHGGVLLGVIGH